MKPTFQSTLAVLALLASTPFGLRAQADLTFDYASRYVWRGFDYGSSPSLQPSVSLTTGNLTVGTWAAYATNGDPDGTEIDFYLSYALGDLTLSVTDYVFPDAAPFFDTSQHFVEVGAAYTLPSLPLTLSANVFVLNDEDYPVYLEAGYSVGELAFVLGFTPAKSDVYGNAKPGLINAGVGLARNVVVTETFAFTLTTTLVTNPYANNAFLLFGVTL
jgi:hypothetical protein